MGDSPSLIPIDLGALFDAPLKRLMAPVEPAIQKLLLVDRLGGMLQSACRESHGQNVFERLLALLDVTYVRSSARLKVGARVIGFNVDPRFSNVLDVLMVADLRRLPQTGSCLSRVNTQ